MKDTFAIWIIFFAMIILLLIAGAIFNAVEIYSLPCDMSAATQALLTQFPVFAEGLTSNSDTNATDNQSPLTTYFNKTDSLQSLVDALTKVADCRQSSVVGQMSFSDGVFYAETLMTTIGYGHLFARTNGGKWWTIIFCYISIPVFFMSCYLLGKKMKKLTNRVVNRVRCTRHPKFGIVVKVFILVVMGQVIFFFIPCAILITLEDANHWTYLDAYYCVINSLGTIGLGDYTPARTVTAPWIEVYRAALYVYSWLGIAYLGHIIRLIVTQTRKRGPVIEKTMMRVAHSVSSLHLPHWGEHHHHFRQSHHSHQPNQPHVHGHNHGNANGLDVQGDNTSHHEHDLNTHIHPEGRSPVLWTIADADVEDTDEENASEEKREENSAEAKANSFPPPLSPPSPPTPPPLPPSVPPPLPPSVPPPLPSSLPPPLEEQVPKTDMVLRLPELKHAEELVARGTELPFTLNGQAIPVQSAHPQSSEGAASTSNHYYQF